MFLTWTGIFYGWLDLDRPAVNALIQHIGKVQILLIIGLLCHGERVAQHPTRGSPAHDVAGWNRAFGLKQSVYESSAYLCLFDLMLHGWRCSNSKDKNYAVLGILERICIMLGASKPPFVVVDYSKTVEEVYCEVTTTVLHNMQRLDLLLMSPDPTLRQLHNLSSWVKDYSVEGLMPLT